MLSFRSEHPWGGRSVGQIYHKAWTSIWPPVLTCNGPPAETSGLTREFGETSAGGTCWTRAAAAERAASAISVSPDHMPLIVRDQSLNHFDQVWPPPVRWVGWSGLSELAVGEARSLS